MKFIFIYFCTIILQVLSFKKIETKICINCKHFIKGNHNYKFGRCSLFPIIEEYINRLNIDEYNNCTTARTFESMCGQEGKMYEKKSIK